MNISHLARTKLAQLYDYSGGFTVPVFKEDLALVTNTEHYHDYRRLGGRLATATEYVLAQLIIEIDEGIRMEEVEEYAEFLSQRRQEATP